MSRANRSRLIVFFLLPMLLLAQGMRICLHDLGNPAHVAEHQHTTPLHLESPLSGLHDHEEALGDVDVPFSALIKLCSAALAFAIVTTVIFLLLAMPQRNHRFPADDSRSLYFPVLHHLNPPLRAPPR
ncbi:MAG: hypothetical protein Q7S51_07905 [Gallionellaceae bacterium]|nr:hypothetical protein [Gallionellaceae bacterium]